MADINIDGVVTWLKNWFYDKTEITGFLNNKANQSDLQTTNSNLANLSSTVDNKVDKVTGKGLSTEDFTTALKDKLDGIEDGANKITVDSTLSSTSENPVQNKIITNALNGKSNDGHTHTISNITDYPTVETENITVTSPTSGNNYFSGGTREITAWKWGKLVTVTVNFYNVGAKASATSTDTTIGTLPTGWCPAGTIYARPNINNNTNIQWSQMSINTSGNIRIRIGSTTAVTGVTFRGSFTFVTA